MIKSDDFSFIYSALYTHVKLVYNLFDYFWEVDVMFELSVYILWSLTWKRKMLNSIAFLFYFQFCTLFLFFCFLIILMFTLVWYTEVKSCEIT